MLGRRSQLCFSFIIKQLWKWVEIVWWFQLLINHCLLCLLYLIRQRAWAANRNAVKVFTCFLIHSSKSPLRGNYVSFVFHTLKISVIIPWFQSHFITTILTILLPLTLFAHFLLLSIIIYQTFVKYSGFFHSELLQSQLI